MGKSKAEKIEFEQKLIEYVKERPAIWKKTDIHHTDAIAVSNHWDMIYDMVKPSPFVRDGPACCRMWKSLWAQYLSNLRKNKGKTGKGGGKKHFYRHSMSMQYFQDPAEILAMSSTVTNVSASGDAEEDEDGETFEDEVALDSDGGTPHESPRTVTVTTTQSRPMSSPVAEPKSTKKPKMDAFSEQLLDVVKGREMTDYEHFCSSIAIKMRKISEVSPKTAVQLQTKIQSLVGEAEIDVLYD